MGHPAGERMTSDKQAWHFGCGQEQASATRIPEELCGAVEMGMRLEFHEPGLGSAGHRSSIIDGYGVFG